MNHLQGHKLLRKDGTSVWATRHLKDVAVIAFFFGASWVRHSYLKDAVHVVYNEVQVGGFPLEVVYVGADEETSAFWKDFKGHPNWVAVEPEDPLRYDLRWIYDVPSPPKLIVVRQSDGDVITRRGLSEIEAEGTAVLAKWLGKCRKDG